MATREGGRAYLLITFDLPNQKIVRTEEVVGPIEGEFNKVVVDWRRVFSIVKHEHGTPKDPPWTRPVIDEGEEGPKGRPRKRTYDAEEPPKDPPWRDPDKEDVERPPDV
jgi:hypothetical protein